MPIFGWMPNADKHSIAEREIADLNATRDGSADRVGAWNWQDDFGAWMAGTTKEEVLELAKTKANNDLRTTLQPRIDDNASKLGHLKSSYQGVEGQTTAQLDQQILEDAAKVKALEHIKANNPEALAVIDTISPTATAGDIYAVSGKATRDRLERKEAAALQREQTIRDTARSDSLNDRAWQKHQAEEAQRYREFQDAQNRKERAAQRADNKELAMIRLAEGKAERLYRRESDERATRRADKKDRQLAIMQLIKGLSQMGHSMAL